MQLSHKQKIFSTFFFFLHFINLASILNIFGKKMILRADVFLKLRTPKDVIREMSKKHGFGGPFD